MHAERVAQGSQKQLQIIYQFRTMARSKANSSILTTGGPSSSCEIIIMRNKSHYFDWVYLRPLLGIKNTVKVSIKNTSPYFHSASLAIWPLTMLKRTHFGELSISRFTTYIRLFFCTQWTRKWITRQNGFFSPFFSSHSKYMKGNFTNLPLAGCHFTPPRNDTTLSS